MAIKSTNKRAKILRAAEKEFAGYGFSGARMKSIAKVSGLDKATLYHYFRTKQELYNAVLEEVIGSFRELSSRGFDHDTDPGEELNEFVSALIDFLDQHKSFALILRREFSGPGRASVGYVRPALAPLIRQVRRYLEESVEKNEMREVDAEHALYSIYEILFGYFTMNQEVAGLFFDSKPYSKEMLARRKEHVTDLIRRLLVPDETKA